MAFKVKVVVEIDDTMRRLSRLKSSIAKKCLKKAVTKGCQALVKHAKQLVPIRVTFRKVKAIVEGRRRTTKRHFSRFVFSLSPGTGEPVTYSGGQLKKSLGYKVRTYKKAIVGICGPREGFRERIGTWSRGKKKGQPIYVDPVNYAHLVELGTRHSAAKPFLRPSSEIGARTSAAVLRAEVDRAIRAESK